MEDITSNGGKRVHLTICKTRTVSIPLALPNDTSSFGLLSQGKKQIKWINGLPLVMWECVEWLCDCVLSRNRSLAQWKGTTSSETNQAKFRPKKGLHICLLPVWLLFKGEAQQLFPKAQGAPGQGHHSGRGKRGWWVTEDPKGQREAPDQLSREERCSPPQRQGTRSWATSSGCWQGSVSLTLFLRSHWQPPAGTGYLAFFISYKTMAW